MTGDAFTPLPVQITRAGAEVLRRPCELVDVAEANFSELDAFARTLQVTLHASQGVGIAANQLGVSKRIIGIEDKAVQPRGASEGDFAARQRYPVEWYWLINPAFEAIRESASTWFEACLSVPEYTAAVPRFDRIRLTGLDSSGQSIEREVSGWHARILQHEIDHLNGHLYLDRMITQSFMHKSELSRAWHGVTVPDIIARLSGSEL